MKTKTRMIEIIKREVQYIKIVDHNGRSFTAVDNNGLGLYVKIVDEYAVITTVFSGLEAFRDKEEQLPHATFDTNTCDDETIQEAIGRLWVHATRTYGELVRRSNYVRERESQSFALARYFDEKFKKVELVGGDRMYGKGVDYVLNVKTTPTWVSLQIECSAEVADQVLELLTTR